jgi:hypothetical protein
MFWHISEEEYNKRLNKINEDNLSKERKQKLKEEKNKHKVKFKLPSTSKLVLFGAILLCLEIIIFCQYAMIALSDTSAMYVLIGIPATLVPVILGYYNKSKAENTSGGIVFETTMMQNKHNNKEDLSGNDAMG